MVRAVEELLTIPRQGVDGARELVGGLDGERRTKDVGRYLGISIRIAASRTDRRRVQIPHLVDGAVNPDANLTVAHPVACHGLVARLAETHLGCGCKIVAVGQIQVPDPAAIDADFGRSVSGPITCHGDVACLTKDKLLCGIRVISILPCIIDDPSPVASKYSNLAATVPIPVPSDGEVAGKAERDRNRRGAVVVQIVRIKAPGSAAEDAPGGTWILDPDNLDYNGT